MSVRQLVALAGRPNVGKSTLTNAIVGAKVAIVSDRPQTTRRAIRGVATGPSWQLVLIDLPGVQRPRDALTQRMARRVSLELADADGALMLLDQLTRDTSATTTEVQHRAVVLLRDDGAKVLQCRCNHRLHFGF